MSTEEVWNTFSDRLHNFIRSKVHDESLADDLLQEVFLKIHLKLVDLQNEEKISSWLYAITRNTIHDYFRKQDTNVPLEEIEPVDIEAETDYDHDCLNSCIKPFVVQLSEEDQSIFNKSDIQQVPQVQIAEEMNIPYSTLKSRVQRIRNELKGGLKECCRIQVNERNEIVDVNCPKCG